MRPRGRNRWRRGAALAGATLLLMLADADPAQGQRRRDDGDPPRVLIAAWGGFSLRDSPTGFRLADDMVELGGRLTLDVGRMIRPWLQADRFTRPQLTCLEGFSCNDEGVVLRAGLTLPFSEDDTRPGVHPRLVAGLGAGWSADTELAYLLGFGAAWSLHPRIAPVFEARWERVPGFRTIAVLGVGLRAGLF